MGFLICISVFSLVISLCAALCADAFLDQPILWGSVGLQYSLNPGVAFGIQFSPMIQTGLILIAMGFAVYLGINQAHTRIARTAYGLVIGGGFANIIDRLIDGVVTDYFRVGSFPIFNVADSCISIGVALLLWEMLFQNRS